MTKLPSHRKKMKYPLELLPQPGFCVPFPLIALKENYGGYAVCYRIEGTVDENCELGGFDGHKVLKEKCFEHVVHLSMNLLGGSFKPEYVFFVQKKPGSNDWIVGESVDFKDYSNCIDECATASPIFYRDSVLCQPSISIPVVFNDKQAYKTYCQSINEKKFPPYKEGTTVWVTFETKPEHCPTKLNYWHVQLEVYPELKDEMLKNDSSIWRSRIFGHIRNAILCHKFEESIPFSYSIPSKLYTL